jgi:hypothetical protein
LITKRGCLAGRILDRIGATPARGTLESVYRELCDCVVTGRMLE